MIMQMQIVNQGPMREVREFVKESNQLPAILLSQHQLVAHSYPLRRLLFATARANASCAPVEPGEE